MTENSKHTAPAPQAEELTIGDLLNQYFDQGRTGKHDEKADAIRLAIAGALQKIRAEADDETYEIGKRDGYSEAVQDIDQRTGGDGEYRYCLGMEDDIRHQPDPATMIQRIVDRFEVLNLLDDATKTGRAQPDDTPAPQPPDLFLSGHGNVSQARTDRLFSGHPRNFSALIVGDDHCLQPNIATGLERLANDLAQGKLCDLDRLIKRSAFLTVRILDMTSCGDQVEEVKGHRELHFRLNIANTFSAGTVGQNSYTAPAPQPQPLPTAAERDDRAEVEPTPEEVGDPTAWLHQSSPNCRAEVKFRWRSRVKGGAWDAWERGRFGAEVPPFMDIEEQAILPGSAFDTFTAERDRLKARVEELEKALEPFTVRAARQALKGEDA